MKIILVGYGKMGKLIEDTALQKEHIVISKIHLGNPLSTADEKSLQAADVCIDFSTPQFVLENIRIMASLKKNIVMGTTGWYEHLDEVKQIVQDNQIGILFSPNSSLGVHFFKNIFEQQCNF